MAAIDTAAIRVGPMRIWTGVTDPGDGAVVDLTSGEPSSGTFLGATDGPGIINIPTQYAKIFAEQETAQVDAAVEVEAMSLEVPAKEFSFANLAHLMPQGTNSTNIGTPAGDARFIGGKLSVSFEMVLAVIQRRDDTSKYIQAGMYRALQTNQPSPNFGRGVETVFTLTWEAFADTGKTDGQKLGYIWIMD